jgi:endonuclease/exonuclease/phosphatase family metal-dependent hydrolase
VLRRRITEIADAAPVIVTGDFNTKACTGTWQRFLVGENGGGPMLADTYNDSHPASRGEESTWHGPFDVDFNRRIDWILRTAHFTTAAAAIDRTAIDGQFPSDHNAVTAVLRIDLNPGARED